MIRSTCCTERKVPMLAGGGMLLLLSTLPAQELTTATADAGGGSANGGSVSLTGSIGGIGGLSADVDVTALRAGFPGQIYDPASLGATPDPVIVPEESSLQLTPVIHCDDDTTLPATTVTVLWEATSPFFSIDDKTGLLTAGVIPGNRSGFVRLSTAGIFADIPVSLIDLTPDNFGAFAADGLDDAWQWDWFSETPDSSAPGDDPDNDGQDNALEFLAGTVPLDSSSFLKVRMEPEPSQPAVRQLFFEPFLPGRTYRWEWSTTMEPPWLPVAGDPPALQLSGEARATDTSAGESRKFYRLHIE